MSLSLRAQLTPLFSQYMLNGFLINPALAGAEGSEVFCMTTRQQWVGYDGNPRTNYLSYQDRILKQRFHLKRSIFEKGKKYIPKTKGRVGVGAYLFNDKNGIIGKTGGQATYAYHIVLGRTGYQLSFGVTAFMYQLRLDQNKMILKDATDPFIYSAAENRAFVSDFAAGTYIRNKKYFAGLSAGQLSRSTLKLNGSDYKNYKPERLYTLIAGMHAYTTSDIDIVTSANFKTTEKLKAQVDLNIMVTFRDMVWIGASYRSNNDVVGIVGMRYNRIFAGYSFDYTTTTIKNQNWGTHELCLYHKFGTTDRRVRWKERY